MPFPPYGTAVPSLSTYQLSYLGLTMGPSTAYGFKMMEGFDQPVIRSADVARPREGGELAGLDLSSGRELILTGLVQSDGTSVQHAMSALATTLLPTFNEAPMWFQFPNLPLLASMVRPRKGTGPLDVTTGAVNNKVLGFHATDPRLYAAPSQVSGGLPAPLGGMHFNATFNLSFGGGSSVTVLSCPNAGNVDTRPVLVITGPVTNPIVTNQTTGWALSFTNPFQSSFTLNAGDTLTVDTDLHTVLYLASGNTVAVPVRNWVVPGAIWPGTVAGIQGLQPGANTISFNSQDSGSVAGTLAVQWSSAYTI